jgi:hypothetical protein
MNHKVWDLDLTTNNTIEKETPRILKWFYKSTKFNKAHKLEGVFLSIHEKNGGGGFCMA